MRIVGSTIYEIGVNLKPSDGARVIDASGQLVLPGGVDPHTHLSPAFVDDLTSGSMAALAGGITTLGTFGTDHAPWTREQKLDPSLSITRLRPGMSDLQFMLPMCFSEGVRRRRLSLERFVATTSTNAARIFGLYPKKGAIREGSDADIVIWDQNRSRTVRASDDLSKADYSVYERWKVTGWPLCTIRRGEIVYDGQVIGRAGTGQLVSRDRWRV